MNYLMTLLGGAIALAGSDKLAGNRDYSRMFRHLGWSDDLMKLTAIAETAGGVLMIPRTTRRLGGAIVAAVSSSVIVSEIRHGETKLAIPRGLVLVAGLVAMLTPGRR